MKYLIKHFLYELNKSFIISHYIHELLTNVVNWKVAAILN